MIFFKRTSAVSFLKHQNRCDIDESISEEASEDKEDAVLSEEEIIQQIRKDLSELESTVVILRIYSSASFKRIAHLTSQSEDAASSVFYRAIGKLRNDPVLLDLATEKVPANVSSRDREDKKV